ncbi:MAG: hypothetical protein AAF085_04745 [Planctomycetota bacterium]
MARGGSSIFISLVVVFVGLLLTIAVVRLGIYFALPGEDHRSERDVDMFGQIYIIWLAMTDPGNMNQDVESHALYKIPAIMAGLAGIVILSMLIAFITTALDQKIGQLKKGHSKVIETNHTLILGWGERITEILRELVIANESEDSPCVVILSDKDKEEMDDYLSVHMPNTQNTRVVTRSGKISSLVNLDIVSVKTCKAVIVLPYCTDAESQDEKSASDTRVIKTILGVLASKAEGQEMNIVAELFTERSRTVANDISDEVTTIDGLDVLAKILVQTSRSIGLSVVYNEIMSFDGCEMYFHGSEEGVQWNGITFGEALYRFPDGVLMGIRRADGQLLVNPPADSTIQNGDDVLIVADDDSTIEFRDKPVAAPGEFDLAGGQNTQRVEHELLIGWNAKSPIVIQQYADYVLEGSRIDIMIPNPSSEVIDQVNALKQELHTLELSIIDADPLRPEPLMEVRPFKYDNIIIFSQGGSSTDPETTDSETIIILLQLRRIFESFPDEANSTKLISEVMNSDNMELVARAGVNDFIVSNRLISMLLSQISEEQSINDVYDDIFEEDGSEIYLKPASLYFNELPAEYSFADMMAIAQRRKEVCIGIKIAALETAIDQNFGVTLIPEKNTTYNLKPDDRLIVVAEDET